MFTHFFIKRPVFASVCALLIVIIGIVGYTRLPVQEYPTIDPPVVTVRTNYPGASPQVVETEVTEILEAQLNGVNGMKTMTSESREGVSSITVEFQIGEDLEEGAQEVRTRVGRAGRRLPPEVEPPVVEKRSGDDERIMWIVLSGEEYSPLELSNYADVFIKSSLETVPGVNSVFIGGERRYAMRVWLDPIKMAARSLTALDVENALRQQNVEIPSGRIEGQQTEYPVRTLGRLQTPQEYEDLIIQRNADGSQVRLREIGRAEIGAENDRVFAKFNGKPAVSLGISKLADANLLEVANGVKARMEELKQDFPDGIRYDIAVDYSTFVEIAIKEVWSSLFLAVVLVVFVIFFFLRDWRATLIPTITIPVSLIGAFGIMFFLGFSINTLTLFSLTLATGLVVDDTIVVLENIVRYIQEKRMKPFPATFMAVGEVVFAVIATTIVLIAVFVPVAFAGGATGRLFNEFALTLAGSVVISSFIALTLAPAIAARLLKPQTEITRHPSNKIGLFLDRILDSFEWFLDKFSGIYATSLQQVLRYRFVVVGGFVASLGLTVWLFGQLPQGFLPVEDRARIFMPIRAPEGVSIHYTNEVMNQVEAVLETVPEVDAYFTIAGSGRGITQSNRGFGFIRLSDWSERRKPEQSQQMIVKRLFGKFSQITDAQAIPINPSSAPGGSSGQPIQFVLQGTDLDELAQVSEELAQKARSLPELATIDADLKINKPELTLEVNRLQAGNLGVSVQDISRTLQILLGGQNITNFNQGNQRYDVIVRAEEEYRASPENIAGLYINTERGPMVPLSQVVNVKASTTPPQINHFNRFRSAILEGSPAAGVTLGDALEALQNLAKDVIPSGMRTTLAGESLEFEEAGKATLLIFGLALIFIFLTLAAQFESYLDPLIILLAVPLALLGAFSALWVAGLELNVYGRIGLIMLIGLATKNSILIVEFANQLREQGRTLMQATLEACKLRFRPILMTAFSTIFGVAPLAFASGAGAASRVSIGMAVLGGMLVSTVMMLYVVPVFYFLATTLQARLMGDSTQHIEHDYDAYLPDIEEDHDNPAPGSEREPAASVRNGHEK